MALDLMVDGRRGTGPGEIAATWCDRDPIEEATHDWHEVRTTLVALLALIEADAAAEGDSAGGS